MTPSMFGAPECRLFGVHHAPSERSLRHAVVLCPPAPQERSVSHWAMRRLADQLARAGHDVLRFDYFGTGDSAGELVESTPDGWTEDIGRAVVEVREISGVRRVSLVGLRMGALLAARAVSGGLAVSRLVLWEPTIAMAGWIDELQAADRLSRRLSLVYPPPADPFEIYGFRLTPALLEQWRGLDLETLAAWTAPTDVVVSSLGQDHDRLRVRWSAEGRPVEWHTAGSGVAAGRSMLGNEAIETIRARLVVRR